jgi:hypothetical protein
MREAHSVQHAKKQAEESAAEERALEEERQREAAQAEAALEKAIEEAIEDDGEAGADGWGWGDDGDDDAVADAGNGGGGEIVEQQQQSPAGSAAAAAATTTTETGDTSSQTRDGEPSAAGTGPSAVLESIEAAGAAAVMSGLQGLSTVGVCLPAGRFYPRVGVLCGASRHQFLSRLCQLGLGVPSGDIFSM